MKDSKQLLEILWGRDRHKIFSIHVSKPIYSLWYDEYDGRKSYQLFGLNYVEQENSVGVHFILWGLNILFAWSRIKWNKI